MENEVVGKCVLFARLKKQATYEEVTNYIYECITRNYDDTHWTHDGTSWHRAPAQLLSVWGQTSHTDVCCEVCSSVTRAHTDWLLTDTHTHACVRGLSACELSRHTSIIYCILLRYFSFRTETMTHTHTHKLITQISFSLHRIKQPSVTHGQRSLTGCHTHLLSLVDHTSLTHTQHTHTLSTYTPLSTYLLTGLCINTVTHQGTLCSIHKHGESSRYCSLFFLLLTISQKKTLTLKNKTYMV